MYILTDLQKQTNALPAMTNEEFLQREIAELENIFRGEKIAVKNTDLEYIAFSETYAKEFNLDEASLGTTTIAKDIPSHVQKAILAEEQLIIKEHGCQDSIYFYNKNGAHTFCGIRKRQLINPSSGDAAGISIIVSKFEAGIVRKLFVKQMINFPARLNGKINTDLTEHQQHIAFCLLLGFHSRKEIAQLIQNLTKKEFNENRVKNGLQALYQKFECNSTGQLLNLIANNQFDMEIHPHIIPEGNYPLI